MKFIKFTLANAEPFSLPYDKAVQVMDSSQQLVMLSDDKGDWSGQTINKAFIICTDRDVEEEASWGNKNLLKLSEETEVVQTPEEQSRTEEAKKRVAELAKSFGGIK